MSLETFKKQILILHSEQSTLDNLSTGFNDRYTVHCATSGSEALNTLGEIQIDVIVSAQELPGMSGLEALREAKKRSPETIGILLAGNEDDGLEALVGDKEVFQIVRGSITPDTLKNLIDNATRQARLVALAESANDTTASPDEPVAEHIVMETSENGSVIISDGTGRMPALDPKKISVAADVGARAVDVLVLTQDEEFLTTVRESARGLHDVVYANTISQADDAIRNKKVGVAVVDAAMIGANVEKITMHLRSASPRLVAIVAGRRDDGEMLMDLINRGKVYRFLLKPVSPGRSRLAIEASVKHHLEAPDSAFKTAEQPPKTATAKPAKAAAAKPQPAPKPQPKPAARPTPQPKQQQKAAEPKPAAPAPQESQKSEIESADTIVASRDDALSPMHDRLNDAFGGDDSSFSQTMTGIVKSVGDSLSKKKEAPAESQPPKASSSGGSVFTSPKVLGIGAAAAVAVIGVAFWLFGGSNAPVTEDESTTAEPSVAESAPAFDTPVETTPNLGLDDLIYEAQLAAEAGRIFNPPGGNAIELYLTALAAAPGDPVAEFGLEQAITEAVGLAESAMLEGRVEDVAAALERIALADPDNTRLPFLTAQLAQMQLRNYLDDARLAIRESRFEDAAAAIDGARTLAVADTTEIDNVVSDLNSALSTQRIDDVLAKANLRLQEGQLIAPSNDNARFYFETALSSDPANAAALQGLAAIASKLVLQARAQIDAGDFDGADALLADARRIDPSSSDLAASTAALQAARDRRADERRAAADRAAADKRAAEKRAADKLAAEKAAADKLVADNLAAEKAAADKVAADKLAAEKAAADKIAADKLAADKAAADRLAAEKLVADKAAADKIAADKLAAENLAAERAAVQQAEQVAQAPQPISVSALKRTKYVGPKYPRAAQRRGLSGWVDVVFTVDFDGTVKDIAIRDSEPGDTFANSAMNAVSGWEYEPVIQDGVAIRKRAAVRMMFAID